MLFKGHKFTADLSQGVSIQSRSHSSPNALCYHFHGFNMSPVLFVTDITQQECLLQNGSGVTSYWFLDSPLYFQWDLSNRSFSVDHVPKSLFFQRWVLFKGHRLFISKPEDGVEWIMNSSCWKHISVALGLSFPMLQLHFDWPPTITNKHTQLDHKREVCNVQTGCNIT